LRHREHKFAYSVQPEWQIRAVDRDALVVLLAQGLSLAEIGRRFGRDESTIGYWVQKHGLQAVNGEKHAPRGPLSRELLEQLIEDDLSIRQIAERTGRCATTVRHWMRRHGLSTARSLRRAEGRSAKAAGHARVLMDCAAHGRTEFWLEGRGAYRCLKCRADRVVANRRRNKQILVDEAGGACQLCGYDRFIGALHFHHRDPRTKSFGMSESGFTRSLEALRAEAAKCDLLCANCHAEVGTELQTLAEAADKVEPGTDG
jgi:transposase